MATAIKAPKLGLSDETTLIGQWVKKKGDKINAGDILLVMETDKASFEVEAEVDGVLLDVFYGDGEEVPVLINIGVIGEEGEDISGFSSAPEPAEEAGGDPPSAVPNEPAAKTSDTGSHEEDHERPLAPDQNVKASPRARRAAERLQLDYRLAEPSGAEDRVMEKDVLALLDRAPRLTSAAREMGLAANTEGTGLGGRVTTYDAPGSSPAERKADSRPAAGAASVVEPEYEVQPLSRIRKVIAQNMMKSLQGSAQLTITSSFDATSLMAYREKVKKEKDKLGLANITINDMVLFAVSRALTRHKGLNAHLVDYSLHTYRHVHLGLAVDTPRGLVVPTLFEADKKSLNELALSSKEIVQKCKDETILPHEMKGASFTVTNLGNLGVETFTPVLNPPQVAILGVGTIVERVKMSGGNIAVYPSIPLSLTFDHRAVDGAPAARFLQDVAQYLEHFELLLAN